MKKIVFLLLMLPVLVQAQTYITSGSVLTGLPTSGTYYKSLGVTSNGTLYLKDTLAVSGVYAPLATPTFTTKLTSPLILGGTGTTSTLTLQTTSGVGTTNADIIFLVGNNGGTEALRINNAGAVSTNFNISCNSILAAGVLRAGATSFIQWNGRSSMNSSSDGVIDMRNNANSAYASVQSLYDRWGSGSPESVVTAPVGATYHRTDGGANTSLYVKESGTGNTGWVAK